MEPTGKYITYYATYQKIELAFDTKQFIIFLARCLKHIEAFFIICNCICTSLLHLFIKFPDKQELIWINVNFCGLASGVIDG